MAMFMANEPVMSPTEPYTAPTASYDDYRAISSSAIVTLILGIISVTALLFASLLFIPVVGLFLGISACLKIKSRPTELTGFPLALIGTVLSALLLVYGSIHHAYVYATEVPEGYQRISFHDLQPENDPEYLPSRPQDMPVPSMAIELDGDRVFVKGYVFPGGQKENLKQFVLVPDMGTCCFGGEPKLTDMIEVTLQEPLRVDFSYRKRKLGGTLKVDSKLKPVSGVNGVYYQLDVDYLK